MADVKQKVAMTAIPVAFALGITGVIVKIVKGKHDGSVTEEVKMMARDAAREIDTTASELKENLEGKSASQLERIIDSSIDTAKKKLDKMAEKMKEKIREQDRRRETSYRT